MTSQCAPTAVHPGRVRILRTGSSSTKSKPGPVIYWMFRDQRVNDNWALLHAANLASSLSAPFAVAFSLFPPPFFLSARARHVNFLLRGLKRLEFTLSSYNIPFFFFKSYPRDSIPGLVDRLGASSLVVDFSPLRQFRGELDEVVERIGSHVAIYQVRLGVTIIC
jgi:deoxyribodipyrimidine photo-lyase